MGNGNNSSTGISEVRTRVQGRAGRITLTRPSALNALTHDMCRVIDATLETWDRDPSVELILIDSEGEKAFCAGAIFRRSIRLVDAAIIAQYKSSGAMNTE